MERSASVESREWYRGNANADIWLSIHIRTRMCVRMYVPARRQCPQVGLPLIDRRHDDIRTYRVGVDSRRRYTSAAAIHMTHAWVRKRDLKFSLPSTHE